MHQSGYWEPLVQQKGEAGHSRRCAAQRWAQVNQGSRRPLLIDYLIGVGCVGREEGVKVLVLVYVCR